MGVRPEILWCGTKRRRQDEWSFPPAVRKLLIAETTISGKTALHLFGGKADFGTRLDVDPRTNPDVVGDAFLPPFAKNSFDCVILDPPYVGPFKTITLQLKISLMRAAGWIARDRVYWFHTHWIEMDRTMPMEKAWLVRVGTQCAVRCLQVFSVTDAKKEPDRYFTRGPAVKYNRWLIQPEGLF